MKKLLIAAMIVLTQVGGAWAQVPKKFQGNWISIVDNDNKSPTKISDRTIDFGSGYKQMISKIEPGDEEGRTLIVTYKPTCSPTPCPKALPVTWVLKLLKLNGRETLMWVNQEDPVNMMITQRAR